MDNRNTGDINFYTTENMLTMKAQAFKEGKAYVVEKMLEGLTFVCWTGIVVLLVVNHFR